MHFCMFDWNDARYFLAIQRTRSLTAAAAQLGVNQSTVGRRLEVLEAALAAKLFLRTTDGYALTEAGEKLLVHAERMEEDAFAIGRELTGRGEEVSGRVCVTTPDAIGPRIIGPLLARLQEKYPSLEVELVADNRALNLARREADLAVRVGRPKEPALVGRRLPDFGHGVYVAKSYVKRHGMPKPDFAGHRALGFEEASRGWVEAQWLEQHAKKAHIAFRCNSSFGHLFATLEGVGFAVLPCYLGDPEPELVRVLPEPVSFAPMWLLVHRDVQHATRVRLVADFLFKELNREDTRIRGTKRARGLSRAQT